ncbi:EamA family transporter [Undibacterium macrobrachii]|jgi:O-acetylserine/cysteine efflux transporter|uniref:O-acetylserine/cysteine exporter n=1 Tax=Undibacterium macrobrachii TaxID=1119058 RepID=A0ABQ2XI88_9BURK|nr:EamA family transporter [Undibacterium macrobrachii]GGX18200.1 O-acetylserine/cysteine exporter [Undibacterium macrobrachii]
MTHTHLKPIHLITPFIVIVLWGMNFVVIKIGLKGIPPLLLAALRFTFVAFPAIFFLAKPKVELKWLVIYATTISFAQFAFLFSAIAVGMPAGLASLVLQAQAFFTVGLAALIFGDRLKPSNVIGIFIASLGLLLLGSASITNSATQVSVAGFGLTLCAALSWACGNIVSKKMGAVNMLSLVAWSALLPIIPFLLLSCLMDGVTVVWHSLTHISLTAVLAILYLSGAASLIGYTLWGKLLAALPTHVVAPLSLLVPVVGLTSAWLILDESLNQTQMIGAMIVMAGLLFNVFGQKLIDALRKK